MNENQELQEMRQQIAILHKKLDEQEIVNSKLMKHVIKNRIDIINRQTLGSYASALFTIIIFPFLHYAQGFSWPLVASTILMMLVCIFATWYYHRPINARLASQDMATVAKTITTLKRRYHNWIWYVTPTMLIPWLSWFLWEHSSHFGLQGWNKLLVCIPVVVGGLVGLLIGLHMHRKVVNACNEIISQIEE
ncbi:MAG: hypothetical protein ACI3X9_03915 [Bacteroidaceae bacterium]